MSRVARETKREVGRRRARAIRRPGWLGRPRLPRAGLLAYLAVMGPGLITANAGNDAGAIATYATAGARFGYDLLWMILLMTFSLAIVQEMAARMGAVTGQGLNDLIRENFGIRFTVFSMLALLVANAGIIVSEFAGMAAALELFGVSRYATVPVMALALWWLVVRGSYEAVERVFLAFTLVFLTYVAAAFLARPDWGAALAHTVVPTVRPQRDYLLLFAATVGTTITPYMQLFQQGAVVEKGIGIEDYRYTRLDVYSGAVFANAIAYCIIVATAATLFARGVELTGAADAARALEPVAGVYAKALFAVGLFGASVLAAGVLPIATARSIAEVFGFEASLRRSWRQAPVFHGLFSGLILLGAAGALTPGLSLFQILLATQVINGVLLPIILFAMLRLVNDSEIMGPYVNGPLRNALAWATAIGASVLSLAVIAVTLLGLVR